MDIRAARVGQLAVLLKEHGNSKVALAKTLSKSPAQVSQWFNGVRSIREDTAREIERRAHKPEGWLDGEAAGRFASGEALVVEQALNKLGTEARREALDFIRYKLERAREHVLAERLAHYVVDAGEGSTDEAAPPAPSDRRPRR